MHVYVMRWCVCVVCGCPQSGKLSLGGFLPLPNLTELTTLKSKRDLSRSVRLEDLVKIKAASECLGKGVSGTVWKVRDKSVDETLALKEMAMDTTDEEKNQVSRRCPLSLSHAVPMRVSVSAPMPASASVLLLVALVWIRQCRRKGRRIQGQS
jgi:hypothetical protein